MTTQVHMVADDTTIQVVGPGQQVGEHTVADGKLAFVLTSGTFAVVVEGSLGALRTLAITGLANPLPDGIDDEVTTIIFRDPLG